MPINLQECQVLLDLRGSKGLRERLESLEGLAPQDHLVPEDCLACQEKMVRVAKMGNREQVVLLDHLEREGCLECPGFLDQKDIADSQDWMVLRDREAVLERRVNRVVLVQWGQLDQWDRQDQEARGEEKDHLDLLAFVELMA